MQEGAGEEVSCIDVDGNFTMSEFMAATRHLIWIVVVG